MLGQVSEKTDTFAFGILLCELLTGLPPADYDKGEWLATAMPEPLSDAEQLLPPLLDKRLDGGSWPLRSDESRGAASRPPRRSAASWPMCCPSSTPSRGACRCSVRGAAKSTTP